MYYVCASAIQQVNQQITNKQQKNMNNWKLTSVMNDILWPNPWHEPLNM
jgi:hypothetical protein